MKRTTFGRLFLIMAVINFVASGRSKYASMFLVLASLYMLADVLPRLWKEWKKCQ